MYVNNSLSSCIYAGSSWPHDSPSRHLNQALIFESYSGVLFAKSKTLYVGGHCLIANIAWPVMLNFLYS